MIKKNKEQDQLELSKELIEFSNSIKGEGKDLLYDIRNKLLNYLSVKKINDSSEELKLRWARSAKQIFNDKWVIEGFACTDQREAENLLKEIG